MSYVGYDNNDPDGLNKVLHSQCECGHQLYQHGNIFGYRSEYVGSHLIVSQCVMCDCKEFHSAGVKDDGSTKV